MKVLSEGSGEKGFFLGKGSVEEWIPEHELTGVKGDMEDVVRVEDGGSDEHQSASEHELAGGGKDRYG